MNILGRDEIWLYARIFSTVLVQYLAVYTCHTHDQAGESDKKVLQFVLATKDSIMNGLSCFDGPKSCVAVFLHQL